MPASPSSSAGRGHERHRQVGADRVAEGRPHQHRLRRRDRGVRVAERTPGDRTALDHDGRPDAEELRLPQHQIGELAGLDGADLVVQPVRDRRVDRVLRDIPLGALVVVRSPRPTAGRGAAFITCATCQVRVITSPIRPIAWASDEVIEIAPMSCRMSSAAMVVAADPGLGEGQILGHGGVEVMADHQHVEVLGDGVHGVRQGRVGRSRNDVRQARQRDDVRRVPAAGTLDVEGVDRPAADRARSSTADVAGLVERVGVQRDLQPPLVGGGQCGVDGGRSGTPVLVQLVAAGAGQRLLRQRRRARRCCPCRAAGSSSGSESSDRCI